MGRSHCDHRRYFPTKSQLLYALIDTHLGDLLTALDPVDDPALTPRGRLEALAIGCLGHVLGRGRDGHRSFASVLHWLSPARRLDVKVKQRWLVALFSEALVAAVPALAERPTLIAPYTLTLFAMLNGSLQWLRETGALRTVDYAEPTVGAIVDGAEAALLRAGRDDPLLSLPALS